MVTRLIFFPLVCFQLWMTVSSAMVSLEEADSFVSVFGSLFKPRGSILEVRCKSINRSVFISVETGGKGGERIIVGRIEEGPAVCSSADSSQTVFDIEQTPPESAAPVADAGENDSRRKVEGHGGCVSGPGGGGNCPGGGDDGPGGDDPGRGGRNNGDEENRGLDDEDRLRREELDKFAKISIFITAQTAASLISFPKENATTSMKSVLYLAVGMDMCAYIFCLTAVLLRRKKPFEASVMTVLGISCSGLGFLLGMCLIVPANVLWIVILASFVLLSAISILFISVN